MENVESFLSSNEIYIKDKNTEFIEYILVNIVTMPYICWMSLMVENLFSWEIE